MFQNDVSVFRDRLYAPGGKDFSKQFPERIPKFNEIPSLYQFLYALSRSVKRGHMASSHAAMVFAPDPLRADQDSDGGEGRQRFSPSFNGNSNWSGGSRLYPS